VVNNQIKKKKKRKDMLLLEGDLCKQSNLFSVHCHFNACIAMSCDIISADSKKSHYFRVICKSIPRGIVVRVREKLAT